MIKTWVQWAEYVEKTQERNKETLDDFMKNKLGKEVLGDYIGLDEHYTIISNAFTIKIAKSMAIARGVMAPRIIDKWNDIERKCVSKLRMGYQFGTVDVPGKVITDRKYYEKLLCREIRPYYM
ncbi:MAG: hypothetical protein KKF46_01625 [Nanoarchaeota archaeon]|nr:hypothetical protein [Nanoarchaeota archaeon]MBU1321031.1 hypothetical protein [Nanoarchaeota archaeon]MBU1598445.1 hypothetical protein [Nanoarchaeota archaeon]MBU2441371.1 hypothetical protein [Nanoarchaeota archaeon]